MLSRVADSIYWTSRYVERAENVARFLTVNLDLSRDSSAGIAQQWQPLVSTSGDDEDFAERYGEANEQSVVQFLAFDRKNPNSILSCLRAARENARTIREIISLPMWRQLNEFYLYVRDMAEHSERIESMSRLLEQVLRGTATFAGTTDSTMSRGEAWHFANLGRMLERADKTTRIIDVKYFLLLPKAEDVGTPFDDIQWGAVLRSADAFSMFRQRHSRVTPEAIVGFLLLDAEFPRAVRFCLAEARESLHAISGRPIDQVVTETERRMGLLCSDLTYLRVEEIIESGLHEFLDGLQSRLNQVGAGVFNTFFAPKLPRRESAQSSQVQTAG